MIYQKTEKEVAINILALRHLCPSRNIDVIEIMQEGKKELTYGFNEQISKAGQEVFGNAFKNINP